MKYSLLFVIAILFSCKNNNPSTSKDSAVKNEAAAMKDTSTAIQSTNVTKVSPPLASDTLYRLVVYFYSNGNGAEYPLINEYIDSIGMYGQNIGKKIEYKRAAWGREGETDVVMRLRELSQAQQTDFVAMSRRVLAKGKFINIYENYPYRQRGK